VEDRVALPIPAPGIRPEPSEVNILTSADPLPASVASYDRWRTGLAQRELFTVAGGSWPVDCVTEAEKEPITAAADPVEFVPVAHYIHHGCEGRVDAEAYKAEALAILDQSTPFFTEAEVLTGATSGNPSLVSTATDITSYAGGSQDTVTAVAILVSAFQSNTRGAKAYIHMPPFLLPDLLASQYVIRQGKQLRTVTGNTVIAGTGYSGIYGPTGSPDAAIGEAYIYVTGSIEVATHTSFVIGSEDNSVGQYARQNLVEFYAERQVIYRFPTTPVFAILAYPSGYTPGS
jgi:hypothetical protein